MPDRRFPLFLTAALLAAQLTPAAGAQELRSSVDGQIRPAEIEEQLRDVDGDLRAGRWKNGLRRARRLTDIVLRRTWRGSELRRQLVELAFQQAVAEANLDRRDEAIWHWHIAQNLDAKVFRRDLAPYGEAGKLLYEYPLRAAGELPPPYAVPQTLPGQGRLRGPVRPDIARVPTVLNNTGAALQGSGDFRVEVIIDRRGRVRQPVVESTHLHPIVIYASLEWLRQIPPFEPARYDGEAVDSLDSVTVRFRVERW